MQEAQNKLGVPTRRLARKFEISPAYVRKILKKAGVVYRKRKRVPCLTEKQEKTQAQRLKKLARQLTSAARERDVVMDDECYSTFADDNAPRNKGLYVSGNSEDVPQKVRFCQKKQISKEENALSRYQPTGRL